MPPCSRRLCALFLKRRLVQALCLRPQLAGNGQKGRAEHEQGSAVVEFTFLALLLMVPLVYFVITVGLSRTAQD